MDYAQNVAMGQLGTLSQGKPQVDRPLDRISVAADRIERCAELVNQFNERFSGNGETCASGSTETPKPYGHNANLARLFDALERLETNIANLAAIG